MRTTEDSPGWEFQVHLRGDGNELGLAMRPRWLSAGQVDTLLAERPMAYTLWPQRQPKRALC